MHNHLSGVFSLTFGGNLFKLSLKISMGEEMARISGR
jgi:hypothetical protein